MSVVVDYAFPPHPSPAALLAAGATGVSRYLSYRTAAAAPKVITGDEYRALLGAGLAVVLNWEFDAADFRGGSTAGGNHAREAIAQARALGYPKGCAIIGSADTDVTRAQWLSAAGPYYAAFAAGLRAAGYRPGIYGPYDVLTWARDDRVAEVYWQAGMSAAWSGGRNRSLWPGAHLRQVRRVAIGGADCDINEIIQANYGQTGGRGMEQTDKAVSPNNPTSARGNTVGDVLVDLGNYRDWGYLVPPATSRNVPPGGSRFDLMFQAARKVLADAPASVTLTDAQVAALGTQLTTAHGARLDALDAKLDRILAALAAAGRAASA